MLTIDDIRPPFNARMCIKKARSAQLGAEDLCPIAFKRTYPEKGGGDNTQEIGLSAFDGRGGRMGHQWYVADRNSGLGSCQGRRHGRFA